MIVISNTTPLIGLSMLGRLELAKILFGEIVIPPAVYHELTVNGAGRIGADEIAKAVAESWIRIEDLASSAVLAALKVDLDEGESEAIALALEKNANLLLLDENKGRAKAKALGLEITGTIGLLLLAREKGVAIDLHAELSNLRTCGFRISDALFKKMTAHF